MREREKRRKGAWNERKVDGAGEVGVERREEDDHEIFVNRKARKTGRESRFNAR